MAMLHHFTVFLPRSYTIATRKWVSKRCLSQLSKCGRSAGQSKREAHIRVPILTPNFENHLDSRILSLRDLFGGRQV